MASGRGGDDEMGTNNAVENEIEGGGDTEDGAWVIEPEFLNPDEVEEVHLDDNNDVPMEDDEDEDDQHNELEEGHEEGDDGADAVVIPDTSNVQIRSHSGPVYAVAAAIVNRDNSSPSLVVVSGGGDDRAYLHQIRHDDSATNAEVDVAASPTSPMTQPVDVSSTLLSHVHTDTVSCVAHNIGADAVAGTTAATKSLFAVGGFDGAIVIYDAVSGECVTTLDGPTDVEWLSFHKSGTVLLVGSSSDGTVWMYHVIGATNSSCLQVFVGHAGTVSAGGFTPDGKWAVTCGADGSVRVWAPKTGVAKHTITFPHQTEDGSAPAAGLTCLAFGTMDTATSKLAMVGSEDGQAHVIHTGTGKILHSLRHYEVPLTKAMATTEDEDEDEELPMSVEAVAFCPHNPLWCATGGMDGVLKIWDLTAGQVRHVCRFNEMEEQPADDDNSGGGGGGITQLAWHDTLPIVFTATTAGTVRLWDARNGALVHTLWTGHSGRGSSSTINALEVLFRSPEKTVVLTASDDHVVRLFEINVANLLSGVVQ